LYPVFTPFYSLGFYGRVGLVPFKQLGGWIGFELSARYAGVLLQNTGKSLYWG
jgi:hypothetical protein